MDRSKAKTEPRAAVRTAGAGALNLLLRAANRKPRELATDAQARRAVPEAAVFRQPQDGSRTGRESQTDAAVDAAHGHRSALRQAELEPSRAGPPGVSVLVARREDRTCKSRLEHRYYLHSDAERLSVPGGGDGLVQPLRAELGTLEHARHGVLFDRARRSVPLRPTRNLELRSRRAIYGGGFSFAAQTARRLHQD